MLTTTVGGIAAVIVTGGLLFRRRLSKNWISPSSIPARQFSREDTIIVTGGNAGIGYEVARELASRGCRVILACRDADAGHLAASNIRQVSGNADVLCMALDLASLRSVQTFAANLQTRNYNIYALICNAGVWMPDREAKTKDGFELHFGVNHLGHFALIRLLVPHMENSGTDSRILIVGSTLCKMGKLDLQTRDFIYDGRVPEEGEKPSFAPTGYCDSKLMNALTCRELAARLRGSTSKITAYAVSPGFCQSRLDREVSARMAPYIKMIFLPLMRFFQRSSAQGAYNVLFVLMEDKTKLESGSMYQDGVVWKEGLTQFEALGNAVQKELWDLSDELIEGKMTEN